MLAARHDDDDDDDEFFLNNVLVFNLQILAIKSKLFCFCPIYIYIDKKKEQYINIYRERERLKSTFL